MKRLVSRMLGAGVVLAMGISSAQATSSVSSQFVAGQNLLSDNSAEFLKVDVNSNNKLDVDDVLYGIFSINSVEGFGGSEILIGGNTGINELTGLFAAQVVSKKDLGGFFSYTFAPWAGFGYGTGSMSALFEDATPDYTRESTITAGTTSASDSITGLPWLVAGMNGSAGEGWSSLSSTDVIDNSTPTTGLGGFYNLGLTILTNNSGLTFGPVDGQFGKADLVGSGSLLAGTHVEDGFPVFDNVDFTTNVVPEPMSMLLLGTGLLGIGFTTRRRNKN